MVSFLGAAPLKSGRNASQNEQLGNEKQSTSDGQTVAVRMSVSIPFFYEGEDLTTGQQNRGLSRRKVHDLLTPVLTGEYNLIQVRETMIST